MKIAGSGSETASGSTPKCHGSAILVVCKLDKIKIKTSMYIQGGQMKSGQILSCNNSKTILNIIFKFFKLVTEYIGCLQRPVEAQWLQVSDLWQRLRGQRLKDSAP